jgi:hypothetical protein
MTQRVKVVEITGIGELLGIPTDLSEQLTEFRDEDGCEGYRTTVIILGKKRKADQKYFNLGIEALMKEGFLKPGIDITQSLEFLPYEDWGTAVLMKVYIDEVINSQVVFLQPGLMEPHHSSQQQPIQA